MVLFKLNKGNLKKEINEPNKYPGALIRSKKRPKKETVKKLNGKRNFVSTLRFKGNTMPLLNNDIITTKLKKIFVICGMYQTVSSTHPAITAFQRYTPRKTKINTNIFIVFEKILDWNFLKIKLLNNKFANKITNNEIKYILVI